jgi:hypothetical protein
MRGEEKSMTAQAEMKRGFRYGIGYSVGSAAALLTALCVAFTPAFAQGSYTPGPGKTPVPVVGGFDKVHVLPPGGKAPRMADGHVDLTGRWYPNAGGRMLQFAYPLDPAALRQFDPKATPEEKPSYKPGMETKNARPFPYGGCDQAGTPSTTLQQLSQHAPMELIQTPGRLVMLDEYPLDVRMIYMNRVHPNDPDPTFNGDSTAHWEGDTLVVDVIGIDTRLRNTVPAEAAGGWFPSEQEHVVERFTRTSKNYLIYQVTIDDPAVLTKPWKSAPRTWSLAQDPHDEWGEVFCTHNEEPDEYKKITDAKEKAK